jgi:hypothetical protein
MFRCIRVGAVWGALTGIALAIILISLDNANILPFSVHPFEERLTFRLCPLYILGFSNDIHSMTALVAVTIAGNAVLYGLAGAVVGAVAGLVKRARS